MPKECLQCTKPLTGKQRQFCCKEHKNQYWIANNRKKAHAPYISGDPNVQGAYDQFHKDFMKLLEDHSLLFKMLREL